MDIGTFLLMQSPSAQPSEEMYARAIEQAQAAEALGFRNMWLAEHHFSTYGYLSRPLQLASSIAREDDAAARRHGRHRRAAAPSALIAEEIAMLDSCRGGRHRHRARARLSALRVRAVRPGAGCGQPALGRIARHPAESIRRQAVQLQGRFHIAETSIYPKAVQKPHPPIWMTAQSPNLDRGRSAPRLQRAHRRIRRPGRAPRASSAALFDKAVAETKPAQPTARRRAARGLRDER